jgi:hypothetical protein
MEKNTIIEPRYKRVIRQYTDEKAGVSYDLIINMKPELRRITAIRTKKLADGKEETDYVVLLEDNERAFVTCAYWKGKKDMEGGNMESHRIFITQPKYDIGALFVSETYVNALQVYTNTESVGVITERCLDFAMQVNKSK